MVTSSQFRALALSLPGVEEKSHFGKPDFRVKNKIFAGLTERPERAYFKARPELQDELAAAAGVFCAAQGAWGKSGWTYVELPEVELTLLRELISEAWKLIAPAKLVAAQQPREGKIGRYRIVRGARPAGDPLPEGVRQDTRKHTRHVLRPSAELVARFLEKPASEARFTAFRAGYLRLLEQRFHSDRSAFDQLREQVRQGDVFLGCNCPTAKQPDVRRCHTYLALGFLAQRYPGLQVQWPRE